MRAKPLFRRMSAFVLVILVVVFMGATLIAGEEFVQSDGRINQVTHFGGDALYCVDHDFNPTTAYSDDLLGGFRLLNQSGDELWFIPSDQISAAVLEAAESGQLVFVAEGQGTYGLTTIYTYVIGESDHYFIFSGYDEFGKPNSVTFQFCTPVGPIPHPDSPRRNPDEDRCEQNNEASYSRRGCRPEGSY